MYSNLRTLLLGTAIVGVMALLLPVAHAITITRAEVQWDEAVIMGRDAAANDAIYWEGDPEPVSTASKRGKFNFRGAVPADCIGTLSTATFTDPIAVELDNCTSDSGEPESIPPLGEYKTEVNAHHGDAVRAVGFASDGIGGTWVISGGEDTFLRSWSWTPETEGLNLVDEEDLDHTIYDLEVSADGSIVVTGEGGWNGGPGSDTLRIRDADGFGFGLGITAPIGFVYCVAISPDNLWTVASGFYGEIVVYNSASLVLDATRKTKKKRTKALAFSPDGRILASTSTAGRIQLWSFPELDLHPVSLNHGGSWVFPIAFAPNSESNNLTQIVSGSDGGTIKVWTVDFAPASPVVSSIPVPSGAVYSLDWWWSPGDSTEDSISMIVAGGDGVITVYDAVTMDIFFQTLNAHTGRVNDVAFSPDGSMIASAGADGELKLWDLAQ